MTSASGESGASGGRKPTGRRSSLSTRSRGEQVRLVLAAVLGGLTVAFALLNLDRVEVNWILGTWNTPLILVIGVSLLVGALLGYAISRRRTRRPARRSTSSSAVDRGG